MYLLGLMLIKWHVNFIGDILQVKISPILIRYTKQYKAYILFLNKQKTGVSPLIIYSFVDRLSLKISSIFSADILSISENPSKYKDCLFSRLSR